MKSFALIAALVVIVGSMVWLFSYYGSQPEPGQTVLHKAPVACAACGKAYVTMLGDQPAQCHYCGEKAVWRAQQCTKCGAIIPVVGGTSFGSAPSLICPKCQCTVFKEVSPDGLEEP